MDRLRSGMSRGYLHQSLRLGIAQTRHPVHHRPLSTAAHQRVPGDQFSFSRGALFRAPDSARNLDSVVGSARPPVCGCIPQPGMAAPGADCRT